MVRLLCESWGCWRKTGLEKPGGEPQGREGLGEAGWRKGAGTVGHGLPKSGPHEKQTWGGKRVAEAPCGGGVGHRSVK